jgi:2-phosphosulfolactate phosphatase
LPEASVQELQELQSLGYLVAAEREGEKLGFADYGNSPVNFLNTNLYGEKLAYSTTNGTQAIEMAKPFGKIAIASFSNLDAATSWLIAEGQDIVILCSGWKNSFSLEDAVCAGALIEGISQSEGFSMQGDAALVSLLLWQKAKNNLQAFCSQGAHHARLEKLHLFSDLDHCFRTNTTSLVPYWDGQKIII